jgi:hypothetical protein
MTPQDHEDAYTNPARFKSGPRFQSREGQLGLVAWLMSNGAPPPAPAPVVFPAADDPLAVTIRAAIVANREG